MSRKRQSEVAPEDEDGSDDSIAPQAARRDPGVRATGGHNLVFGLDGVEEDRGGDVLTERGHRRRASAKVKAAVFLALLAYVFLLCPGIYLKATTSSHRFSLERAPAVSVALVMGSFDSPSSTDHEALMAAAQQMKQDRRVREVLSAGPAGLNDSLSAGSPYEACLLARRGGELQSVVIVAPRSEIDDAVYSCRQLGVEAFGVGVGDKPSPFSVGESLDAAQTMWNVHITRPGRPPSID